MSFLVHHRSAQSSHHHHHPEDDRERLIVLPSDHNFDDALSMRLTLRLQLAPITSQTFFFIFYTITSMSLSSDQSVVPVVVCPVSQRRTQIKLNKLIASYLFSLDFNFEVSRLRIDLFFSLVLLILLKISANCLCRQMK